MRVFIAVDLPNELRKELGELERQLKPLTDTARWVAPESIHITLKFIGEVPEKRAEDVDAALTGLTWKPFTITVRGVGFFPGNRSPRVFWAGMEAPTMQDLAVELDSRMERLGFDKEKRAFRPHITLARVNRDVRLWAYETYLVETMIATRENPIYLPSVRVPESVRVTHSMEEVLRGARIIIMAVPSHVYRQVFSGMLPLLNGDMF